MKENCKNDSKTAHRQYKVKVAYNVVSVVVKNVKAGHT